jgi:hypothetical protein
VRHPTAAGLLALIAACALCVLAALGGPAEQLGRVLAPKKATVRANGKDVELEPLPGVFSAVVRDGTKDKDHLGGLQKDGKEPAELIATDAGKVHIGRAADLKEEAELKKLAAAGKLPPLYPAFKFNENIVLLDGTLLVKLKDKDKDKAFLDFCKKEKLAARARPGEKGTYAVAAEDGSASDEPFAAAREIGKLAEVESAEPVFIILVKAEDEKPPAKDKAKGEKEKP